MRLNTHSQLSATGSTFEPIRKSARKIRVDRRDPADRASAKLRDSNLAQSRKLADMLRSVDA